jgi:hypothetical protein
VVARRGQLTRKPFIIRNRALLSRFDTEPHRPCLDASSARSRFATRASMSSISIAFAV